MSYKCYKIGNLAVEELLNIVGDCPTSSGKKIIVSFLSFLLIVRLLTILLSTACNGEFLSVPAKKKHPGLKDET